MLTGKGILRSGYGNKEEKGTLKAAYGFEGSFIKKCFISHHPLTNFEIRKYYRNEPRFNGVYSRDNSSNEIKDGAYVINLDEYADVETHWIALYASNIEIIYFDSFGLEHVPNKI